LFAIYIVALKIRMSSNFANPKKHTFQIFPREIFFGGKRIKSRGDKGKKKKFYENELNIGVQF
jgi:hypothetical protein